MNRILPAVPCCLMLGVWGCMMPIGVERPRTPSAPSARAEAGAAGAGVQHRDSGPAEHLRVNAETISAERLWMGLREELADRARDLGADECQTYVNRLAAQLIRDRIAEMLLYQQASLRLPPEMVKNIDEHVDGEIRKIVTTQHRGVQRVYEKHLAERGMTIDDVRKQLRREVIIAGYLDRDVKPKVAEPTRAELYALFQANRDRWRKPARRRMSLIDVRVLEYLPEGVDHPTRSQYDAARAEARSTIQTIEAELLHGGDFAALARRHSHGLHAAEGGSWGFIEEGSVRERFEPALDALATLEEGEVSGVIETTDGFFLVRCDELEPAVELGFQDIQPTIQEQYFRASYNGLIAELVENLRREAYIEPASLDHFHTTAAEAGLAIADCGLRIAD